MSGFSAALTAAGAKEARKALRGLFGRKMSAEDWRLVGRYDEEPRGDGWYMVRIDPDDPLRLEHLPTGQKLVVPFAEILTDYASVPKMLQGLADGSEVLHLKATDHKDEAVFHDMLYAAAGCYAVKKHRAVWVRVTKAQADAVLYVCMKCRGATLADGLAYHGAVSLCGGPAWKKCRRENAEWPKLLVPAEET